MDTKAIVTEKECKRCGDTKPITEFHTHSHTKDGYLNICKTCKNLQQKQYKNHNKNKVVDPGESLAVKKLRSIGIYAASGKASEWQHQDVVAWGCVRIEVKLATLLKGKSDRYEFKFDSQAAKGMNSQLILLILAKQSSHTFHLFPADHTVFFRNLENPSHSVISATGRKKGLQYIVNRRWETRRHGEILTTELMEAHQDKWELIEDVRQRIILQMLNEDIKLA